MDYIISKIEENIELYDNDSMSTDKAKLYRQIRVEYSLMLLLSYLWNKNFHNISDFTDKELISRLIIKPTFGNIINLAKKLDIQNQVFNSQNTDLFDYIELRNEQIGHGYSIDTEKFNKTFDDYYAKLRNLNVPIWNDNSDFILIEDFDAEKKIFIGQNFSHLGRRLPFRCTKEVFDFKKGNLYLTNKINEYCRVSPFIHIEKPEKIYIFQSISELLLGRIQYNRVDDDENTIKFTKDWDELCEDISSTDGVKEKTPNKTIINRFENNFNRFIEVGVVKDKITSYLTGNKKGNSVAVTVWGHGGVGKTATVQRICDNLKTDLKLKRDEKFDYIIFLSAKDRRINLHTGKVEAIDDNRIDSYESLIRKVNLILFNKDSAIPEKIIEFKNRMLLIIDDYETFESDERQKIRDFIERLENQYHKVIITTRNKFLSVGSEVPTGELNEVETSDFLKAIMSSHLGYPDSFISSLERDIQTNKNRFLVHQITTGRPLFIFIFANYLAQKGSLQTALKDDKIKSIKSNEEAIKFLFGRVYQQLGDDSLAKDIFCVIGRLTPQESLTSLTKHISYVLNQKDEILFNTSLEKLQNLKIIEIDDNGFYQVYSKEILSIMLSAYEDRSLDFKSNCKGFLSKIENNKDKDTFEALLINADQSRFKGNEQLTIDSYREIIKREDATKDIKIKAILKVTDFLARERNNPDAAIKMFDDSKEFIYEPQCVRIHSEYCWSSNNREKCIEILTHFYLNYSKKGVSLNNGKRIQMLSLLVLRKSLNLLDKENGGGMSVSNFRQECNTLLNQFGNTLFIEVQKTNVDSFEPGERQDTLVALSSLVDIYSNISNNTAYKICTFVLDKVKKVPSHMEPLFKKKLSKTRNPSYSERNNYRSEENKITHTNDIEKITPIESFAKNYDTNQSEKISNESSQLQANLPIVEQVSLQIEEVEKIEIKHKLSGLTILGKIELPEKITKIYKQAKKSENLDLYLGSVIKLKGKYGYLSSEQLAKDVYFYWENISETAIENINEGDNVEFSIKKESDGVLTLDKWGHYVANQVHLFP